MAATLVPVIMERSMVYWISGSRINGMTGHNSAPIDAARQATTSPPVRSARLVWKFRNLLLDANGAAAKDWEVQIYPTSYLIDPRGDIRYVAYGAMDWDSKEVMQVIDALLNESP